MLDKMKLGTKFILTAVMLVVFSTAIVGAIGFVLGRRGIETHTNLHLQSVVTLGSEKITGWLEFQRTLVNSDLYPRGNAENIDRLLGEEPGSPAHDEAVVQFEQNVRHVGLGSYPVLDVALLNPQGRVQYSSNPGLLGRVRAMAELVEAGSKGGYVGLTWEDLASADAPLLVMAEPALGEVAGVAVAYIDPTPLQAILKPDAAMGDRGRLYLAQPGEGLLTASRLMQDTTGGAMHILQGVDGATNSTFTTIDGLKMVGRSSQVGNSSWKLVAAIPTDDAFADVGEMRLLMALALLVIGAGVALVAWRLSVRITGPLRAAAAGANAIGKGDLDYSIAVGSGDEVGELATSLNEMAASLAESRSNLIRAERRIASQEMSDRVLQAVPISLLVLDEAGRIESANSEFCKTFSLSREKCAGQLLSDVVSLGSFETELARSLRGKTAFQGQWSWQDRDADQHQFYVSINPLAADNDRPHQVILALEDITDRIAAEWRYRELMENANDAVFIIDAKTGEIQESNTRAAEMVGVSSQQDLVGRDIMMLHPSAIKAKAHSRLGETIRLGAATFDDLPLVKMDGSELEVQISAKVVDLGGERLIHSVVRDISDQKAADRALRESEARFRELYDEAPVGYCELDPSGRIKRVNKTQVELLGYKEEEMVGRYIWEFSADEESRRVIQNRIESKVPLTGAFEATYRRKDGTTLTMLIEEKLLEDDNGNTIGVRCTFQDITERKQAEERLREASRLASVGELAAGVAHEINNPLTSILGFSELLMDEDLPEQTRSDARRISSDAQRAARVVQNLLSFARKHEPQTQFVPVTPIIEKALELRAYEFDVNNIEVTTELGDGLPNTMVDEHQLLQVLVNILTNAEQAMAGGNGKGLVNVRTGMLADRIRISVSDNGPGVSPESLAKIFDPFYTTKEVGKGTGLGLSLSYGIVSQHGGDLWAENNPENGMTFHIELPVKSPEGQPDVHHPDAENPLAVPKHVLVVDDEASIREMLARQLSVEGLEVDVASSGDEGWAKVQDRVYDRILLDMKMPGMGGRELYELIKELDTELAGKIIFVTGDTLTDETRDFLDSTGNPKLSKPFQREKLRKVILGQQEAAE